MSKIVSCLLYLKKNIYDIYSIYYDIYYDILRCVYVIYGLVFTTCEVNNA